MAGQLRDEIRLATEKCRDLGDVEDLRGLLDLL
jgi:hypothetical protein